MEKPPVLIYYFIIRGWKSPCRKKSPELFIVKAYHDDLLTEDACTILSSRLSNSVYFDSNSSSICPVRMFRCCC